MLKIRMIFGLIWVEVAQIELKLGWFGGNILNKLFLMFFGYLAAYFIKQLLKTKKH